MFFRATPSGDATRSSYDLDSDRDTDGRRRFCITAALGAVWIAWPFLPHDMQIMFTPYAIILANIFVTFPLAFGVIMPVLETMSRSLEEASATMGASRWQTFWYVTLPSLRGAIVGGALLTFARAVGEFGSTILVSGNLPGERRLRRFIYFPNSTRARSRPQMRLLWYLLCFLSLFLACCFLPVTGWRLINLCSKLTEVQRSSHQPEQTLWQSSRSRQY